MDVAAASFFGSPMSLAAGVIDATLTRTDFQRAVAAFAGTPQIRAPMAPLVSMAASPSVTGKSTDASVVAVQKSQVASEVTAQPAILLPGRSGLVLLAVPLAVQPQDGTSSTATTIEAKLVRPASIQVAGQPVEVVPGVAEAAQDLPDSPIPSGPEIVPTAKGPGQAARPAREIGALESGPPDNAAADSSPLVSAGSAAMSPVVGPIVIARPPVEAPGVQRCKTTVLPPRQTEEERRPQPGSELQPPPAPLLTTPTASVSPAVAGTPVESAGVLPRQSGPAVVQRPGPGKTITAPATVSSDVAPAQLAKGPPAAETPMFSGSLQTTSHLGTEQAALVNTLRARAAVGAPLGEVLSTPPQLPAAGRPARRIGQPQPSSASNVGESPRSGVSPVHDRRPQVPLSPAFAVGNAPVTSDKSTADPAAPTPPLEDAQELAAPIVASSTIAGTQAPAHVAPAAPAPVPLPYRAVMLAHDVGIVVAHRIANGDREVTISMAPADFGRIDVRMSFDDTGKLRATVGADNPLVLDLLRRDVAQLAGAMSDAGISSDQRSFRFETQGDGQGQRSMTSGDGQPRDPRQSPGREAVLRPAEDPESTIFQPLRWTGQIDVTA